MKNLILVILIGLFFFEIQSFQSGKAQFPASTQKSIHQEPYLETQTYKIYIQDPCPLYENVCGNVKYTAINKKNNHKITLTGTTLNEGPQYQFKGYRFNNGNYSYSVIPIMKDDLDDWSLKVVNTNKNGEEQTLVQEIGKWNYNKDLYWETSSYKIFLIDEICPEGSIDCQNIVFRVINKQNRRQLTLKAEEEHRAPSYDLYGYHFKSGILYYTIRYFANAQGIYVGYKNTDADVLVENILKETISK